MNKKLESWKSKLQEAITAYCGEREAFDLRDKYYSGTRDVFNKGSLTKKKAGNVRNIVYELIESQVDPTIPQPKVEAIHEEDQELAKNIEEMLRSVIQQQRFSVMNDLQERTVPIQGGAFWHIEWDPKGGSHCVLGDVVVSDRHPKQFIPQPGITNMRDMDYMFLQLAQSAEYIKRRYNVDVEDKSEESPEVRSNGSASSVDGMCTQNIVYYRNQRGGIGMYSWVNDQVLVDNEDYQARRLERCKKCGAVKKGDVCECGSTEFKKSSEEYEEIEEPVALISGEILPEEEYSGEDKVQTDPIGAPMLDENGAVIEMPIMRKTRIPYYKPNSFPIILRKNVSKFGYLMGGSDVDVVEDQQDAIKKYGTKLDEKLLKGGSFVTLPEGVNVETDGEELRIIRLRNPSEKSLIDVINVSPDVTKELTALEQNYAWAKSTLGITDAFQGKYDASATSGTAKQFSANQAAGRLLSKKEQKNNAYSDLYKMIFQFMLAYSDQRVPISYQAPDGSRKFTHFNRYDFLRRDEAGELYWDDEFIFSIDSSATMSSNRDILWGQLDLKFQNGAFGPLNEKETLLRYWTQLASTNYPFAEQMKKSISDSIQKEEEMQNAMSAMQNGAANQVIQGNGDPGNLEGGIGAGAGMPEQ